VRICLCRRGATKIVELLRAALPQDEILECSSEEVASCTRQVEVLIPLIAPVTEDAFASPRLRLVQQFGAGLDGVDVDAASRYGVYVANVPSGETANADSVAELAILLMLALARRWARAQENLQMRRVGAPVGTTLMGKTVTIVGFGGIGRALAKRLRALGVRIVAVSRSGAFRGEADHHLAVSALPEALREADFIVVATPLTDETRGLIGKDALACIKQGAFLINVARGPVVDREALLAALVSGKLAGAGLDVFWEEPPDPLDRLFSLEVVATPHIGGATDLSLQEIARGVAENVDRLRRGEALRNCVNESSLRAKAPQA
jgi:phosphoglycerate dehydrogenase-like enzyme